MNYRYDFTPKAGLWIEGGVGPNFRMMTKTEYSESGNDEYGVWSEQTTTKYKTQTSFGLQVGGGVMLNDQISIGVHYYGLGKAKIKATERWSDTYDGETDSGIDPPVTYPRKSAQNSILLRLGYHF